MKKLPNNKELEKYAFRYSSLEGLCDTIERFGLGNPGKCTSCDDYGCSSAIDDYLNRFEEIYEKSKT